MFQHHNGRKVKVKKRCKYNALFQKLSSSFEAVFYAIKYAKLTYL